MLVTELHKYDRMPLPDPKPVLPPHEAPYRWPAPRAVAYVAPTPFWRVWLDSRN